MELITLLDDLFAIQGFEKRGGGCVKDFGTKKRYANIKQVSEYTSLPVKTLYEWASVGRIPSIKYGRRVLFDLQDIDKVMDSLKRKVNQIDETANKIIREIDDNNI